MKKLSLSLFVFLSLFFLSFRSADASLVTIEKDGQVVKKVLSLTDEFGVDKLQGLELSEESKPLGSDSVLLSKDDGGVYLALGGEGKKYDIKNLSGDIVEIEERENYKKLRILTEGENFILLQEGFEIKTDKNIEIDPKTGNIFVESALGKEYLSILPLEAATTTLRSKYVSEITSGDLLSNKDGRVVYRFNGEKKINILGLLNYSVPVSADLSVSTGEIENVNQPVWLKILGFLS